MTWINEHKDTIICGLLITIIGGLALAGIPYVIKKVSESKTNSNITPIEMVRINGGKFVMGDNNGKPNEKPSHQVRIGSFFVDTKEVTQTDYSEIMEKCYGDLFSKPLWTKEHGLGDSVSAYYVNWYEAVLFCNARTKEAGSEKDTVYQYDSISGRINDTCVLHNVSYDLKKRGYRLPTEAEWEFMAKQKDVSNKKLSDYAQYNFNTDSTVQSVGGKKNVAGIYDLFGNVYEWCNDWYSKDYYRYSDNDNPTGPSVAEMDKKVIRGGSVCRDSEVCSPTKRMGVKASVVWKDCKPDIGLRCVRTVK